MLEIQFSDVPSFPVGIMVRAGPDGTIALPHNVTLSATGRTTIAFADDIRAAYVPNRFDNMKVSITILDFGCLVMGEVNSKKGRFLVASNLTVLRAVEAAGGPTSQADLENIELRRRDGTLLKVDWGKARKNPKLDPVVTRTGGDVIMVPRKGSSR